VNLPVASLASLVRAKSRDIVPAAPWVGKYLMQLAVSPKLYVSYLAIRRVTPNDSLGAYVVIDHY